MCCFGLVVGSVNISVNSSVISSFISCVVGSGLLALLVLLGGCAQKPRPEGPAPVLEVDQPSAPVSGPSQYDPRSQEAREARAINRLMTLAEESVGRLELTTPDERNAKIFYLQVLKIDPDYAAAQEGLAMIAERYIEWADAALQRGAVDKARVYLQRAQSVEPRHPQLSRLQARLERTTAKPEVVEDARFRSLDAAALRARSEAMQQRLAALADEIKALDTRVTIEAPNDRLGRWVYQQLNNRHEEYRIRANMKISKQPGLRYLD